MSIPQLIDIDRIVSLAQKGSGITVKDYPGDEAHRFLVFNHDTGELQTLDKPGHPRDHMPMTPSDLADYIKDVAGKHDYTERAIVRVNEDRVTYYPDGDDTRLIVTTTLSFSPQYQWFIDHGGQSIGQKQLVRDLRVILGGAVPPNVLAAVRNVRFNAQVASNIQVNSLGKSVNNDIGFEVPLPEECTVTLPVFQQEQTSYQFGCFIEQEPETQTFRLTPYPLALENVLDYAKRTIGRLFDDLNVQIVISH